MDEVLDEDGNTERGNSENLSNVVQPQTGNPNFNVASPSKSNNRCPSKQSEQKSTRNGASINDWESPKSTIRARNAVMFNNKLLSDVQFLVGPPESVKSIPAHKYVLAIGSSVFFAMFNSDLAENERKIKIPDVDPTAFLNLLRYLYCDEVCIESDSVLAMLYAAKKYIVPFLAQECVQFLETSLSHKNACILLSQSCLFEERELTQRCWEVIDAQAELALQADDFVDIDSKTLSAILSRETLNVRETAVFYAAQRWASAECKRQNLEPNCENKRKVLGSSLYLIRIPTMTLQEFADGPAESDVLTKDEIIKIFFWYSATNKPHLPFPTLLRQGLTPHSCHRFQSSAYRSNQWRYRGRCDSICFMAEKRIFVAGYGLYGSSTGAANYVAQIKLSHNGSVLAEESVKFFSDGCSKTFPVWFRHPVQCEPGVYYTASAVLDGNELSYFGQEGLAEVVCDGVTIQFQCSIDSTNGTGVQGGQIPELIFYHGDV